jgi:hypothetical protein
MNRGLVVALISGLLSNSILCPVQLQDQKVVEQDYEEEVGELRPSCMR